MAKWQSICIIRIPLPRKIEVGTKIAYAFNAFAAGFALQKVSEVSNRSKNTCFHPCFNEESSCDPHFSSETNRESCCRTFLQNSEIRSLNLYIDDTKKLFDRTFRILGGKILPRINVFDTRKSIKSIYDDGWKKDWNNRELELKRYEVCMEDQSPSSSMFLKMAESNEFRVLFFLSSIIHRNYTNSSTAPFNYFPTTTPFLSSSLDIN